MNKIIFQGDLSDISLDEIIERRREKGRPTIMCIRGWYTELHHEVFLRVMPPERDYVWEINLNKGNPIVSKGNPIISSEMEI